MIAERINNTIEEMIRKTQSGFLKWNLVENIKGWENIKKQIEQSKDINLKHYYIDDSKSYGFCKCGGYVLVLNIRYTKALIFSPVLDRHVLVVKVNDDFMPENLSNYDYLGYEELLSELVDEIEYQRENAFRQPEYLYNFLEEVLEGEVNGNTTNE